MPPILAKVFTLRDVKVPSLLAPTSISVRWSLPWVVATKFSDLVSIHFIGRSVFLARAATRQYSGYKKILHQNPPPTCAAITLIFVSGIPNTNAVANKRWT